MPGLRTLACSLVLLACCISCGGGGNALKIAKQQPRNPDDEMLFVRDGVIIPAGSGKVAMVGKSLVGGRPFDGVQYDERLFLIFVTDPGERVTTKYDAKLRTGITPVRPTAWRMDTLPLEDVRNVTLTGNLADSVTAIAGTTVAVGTYNGRLHLKRFSDALLPESTQIVKGGMVKALAFPPEPNPRAHPPDGSAEPSLLYLGEQSVRGRFRALQLPDLEEEWGFDLAQDLGEGKLPGAENPYGIYELPGVFQIVSRRNRVMFVGVRSFVTDEGKKENRSRLYCFSRQGEQLWAWPPDSYAPLNILRFDANGGTIVLATSRSAEADAVDDDRFQDRAVYVLDSGTGIERAHLQIPALPNFPDAPFIWQSVGINGEGTIGAIGLSDGRAILLDLPAQDDATPAVRIRSTIDLGAPIATAGITLTAPVSYATCHGDTCYFHTSGSNIPPGATTSASTPPAPHPGANTLVAVDANTGEIKWSYRNPAGFNGLFLDGQGRSLLTTTGNPLYPDQATGYGILLFDAWKDGSGEDKIVWQQPLETAPFFNAAISHDGFFVAVTETPLMNPDGVSTTGTYQTHVYH